MFNAQGNEASMKWTGASIAAAAFLERGRGEKSDSINERIGSELASEEES